MASSACPSGVTIGQWSNETARTGCSVILFDRPALAAIDVRGGAPGTRESGVLGAGRLVQRVDAIVLTGGSAFGLATADGVMRWLAERGRGFPTPGGPVPIVPAAVIYDLGIGHPVAPDAAAGAAACGGAGPLTEMSRGQVGAGTGATSGKATSSEPARGGIGLGHQTSGAGGVTAVVVVNAYGDIVDPRNGHRIVNSGGSSSDPRRDILASADLRPALGESTSLAVVLVDGPADQAVLTRCALAAHDAFAHAIRPCHTIFDGDLVFAVTTAEGSRSPVDTLHLSVATELAVEQAIIDAVVT